MKRHIIATRQSPESSAHDKFRLYQISSEKPGRLQAEGGHFGR